MKNNKLLINLLLSLISIAITFSVIEIAARYYLWNIANETQFSKYASIDQLTEFYGDIIALRHQYLGYVPTRSYDYDRNKHNSLGFRGEEVEIPKPAGVYRIVAIGGSTTYSLVEDYRRSYPYLLQNYLNDNGHPNVEVINAGMSGYSTWESLINLEFRVLETQPDLIIIYHNINDVDARIVWPPTAYLSDNSGLRAPYQFKDIKFWEESTAIRALLINMGLSESHNSIRKFFNDRSETAYNGLFQKQVREGTYPSNIFEEVSVQEMLNQNPPIYYERNIRSMIGIAQAHDVKVMLATFSYSRLFVEDPRSSSPEFTSAMDEHNEIMRMIADSSDVYFYDFVKEMPTEEIYFIDGHHFTIKGNNIRAEMFATYIIEQGFVEVEN